MRKSVLIGLLVCLLALGGIGAAFATGMGFSNVGALSQGKTAITQVDTDYVGYLFEAPPGGKAPWIDKVELSFNRNLRANTVIWVEVRDAADGIIGLGTKNLPGGLLEPNTTIVGLDKTVMPGNAFKVEVYVAE